MNINIEEILKLANLQLSKEDLSSFNLQLKKIESFVNQIEKISIKVRTSTSEKTDKLTLKNIYREDLEKKEVIDRDLVLEHAPLKNGDYFLTQKLINK